MYSIEVLTILDCATSLDTRVTKCHNIQGIHSSFFTGMDCKLLSQISRTCDKIMKILKNKTTNKLHK